VFRDAFEAAQESPDACTPDLIVEHVWAVGMNVAAWDATKVLIASAWKAW